MKKSLALPIAILLLVLPLSFAISGTIASNPTEIEVVAGQSFSILSQIQLTSNECSFSQCLLELDPISYNGQPIGYIGSDGQIRDTAGNILQAILNLGTFTNSACNQNPYYAGYITTFGTSTYYQAYLKPKAPLQTGNWQYQIKLYSGCGGNELLRSNIISVKVSASTTPPVQDVTVYCLASDKLSCETSLNTCPSGKTQYSTPSECTSNMVTGGTAGGGGGTSGGTSIDFRLSNIKYVRSGDLSLSQAFTIYSVFGLSPIGFKVETLKDGQLVAVDITNVGSVASGATLEAYYVSKDNPFLSNSLVALGTSIPYLQSFLGKTGITEVADTTCKSETGARYNIETIQPSVTNTFWIYVPYPKQGDTLAGNNNYHTDKQYLLNVNILDNCNNKNVYDAIGATVNGFRVAPNQVPAGGVTPQPAIVVGVNDTPINANARQKTVSKDKVTILTSTELIKSSCSDSDMCEDDAICQSLDSLKEEGTISESRKEQDAQNIKKYFDTALVGVGGIASAFGGVSVGVSTIVLSATASSVCLASFPVCAGVLAFGGALVGGTLSKKVIEYFNSLTSKDTSKLGYCVPKEETSTFSFTKIITSIGRGVNEVFGGQTKTKLTNETMGWIVLVVVGIIILLIITKK